MTSRSRTENDLPAADADSAAHSARVAGHLRSLIEDAGGSVSFAAFMQEALYAPGLGYYAAGARKLGAGGDFVTAPEISPLFGYVVARQAAAVLEAGGDILEAGAGTGALAVAMLTRLAELGALPDSYLILEVSADLADRQRETIRRDVPGLADRVRWVAGPPEGFQGVVIANEVADALPVERFRIAGGSVQQARVVAAGDGFDWQYVAAPSFLERAVHDIERSLGDELPDGYVSEVSAGLAGWIGELAECLRRGLILIADYGVSRREYYAPDRDGGWLRCHFRHHVHDDPLILVGIQDLTAWVDFTRVAEAAVDSGLDVCGYTTQSNFLMGGGLEQELAGFTDLPMQRQVELSGQVKLLTLPAEMGENFKFIGLRRGNVPDVPAFRGLDRAHLL